MYTVVSWGSMMYMAGSQGIPCREIQCYDQHPISAARNLAVTEFLQDKNNSHILFLDDDVVVPPDIIPRLLNHKKLITSGWYLLRGNRLPSVFQKNKYGWTPLNVQQLKPNLMEVDGTAAGALMIDRKALEVIKPPWFLEGGKDSREESTQGEDLYFCQKAHDYGMKVYVDGNLRCGHHHFIVL